MKHLTISKLKQELLVVELPRGWNYEIEESVVGFSEKGSPFAEYIEGSHTLLGSPDEIREEDAAGLVEKVMNGQHFQNYNPKEVWDRWCKTATESLLSAIETKVFWDVNPIEEPIMHQLLGQSENENSEEKAWQEAENKTFDRKRSIILKKN